MLAPSVQAICSSCPSVTSGLSTTPYDELTYGLRAPAIAKNPKGLQDAEELHKALGDKGECISKLIEILKAEAAKVDG